ncbi:MAG: Asp-tRNA(Asn)/Glu-tRNA(Gln) amidotransferase GatCAB subunit B, partial [Candidatus Fonsibacter sp.]
PDLLPLELENSFIQKIKNELPELPDQKKDRFINEYRLSNYEAAVLTADKETADFFEKVAKNSDVKLATTWIMGDFFASLNKLQKSISNSPITVENLASLLNLIKTN